MMKQAQYLLIVLFFWIWRGTALSQASSSSEFKIRIGFETEIEVENIEVHSFKKDGNIFERINYRIDKYNNEIVLFGYNDYVLWVSFPTIVFSEKSVTTNEDSLEQISTTQNYYLVTSGALSSYSENQTQEIVFTKRRPNILISLENRQDEYKISRKIKPVLNSFRYGYKSDEFIKVNEL